MSIQNKVAEYLLLVEDDRELAQMIVSFLSDEGYSVDWVDNGREAVERLARPPSPDLVILDVMLPEVSGIDVCRQVEGGFSNPILMLTARNDDLTEITSLDRGASGFLTKPVRPHVLLAHVRALLRAASSSGKQSEPSVGDRLTAQDISVYPSSLTARVDERELDLTTAEYQLLELLVRNAGRLVTREELYRVLRGIDYDGLDRSIDMRVSALRTKMGDTVAPFRYIKTVRGQGYLLATA